MMCRILAFCAAVSAVIPGIAPSAQTIRSGSAQTDAATHVDVLNGRVMSDSGRVIAAASVIVTRAPDRAIFQTTTDADGRWQLRIEMGTGDYLVYVSAAGFSPVRRRVTREQSPTADVVMSDSGFVVASTLKRVVPQTLATVDVVAKKPRAKRSTLDLMAQGVGASELTIEGVNGRLSPELEGNLNALAATMPGIVAVDGGISTLGLGASQSSTTLSGMQFSGQDIPRDLRTMSRVATSTYDPSRGWFGGAQVTLEISPGLQYAYSNAHLTLDAPALQSQSPIGNRSAAQATNVQGSFAREAGALNDRLTYSLGLQGSRRAQDAVSIYTASADALRQSGISPDSAQQLRSILATTGIPVSAAPFGSAWRALTDDRFSFAARLGTPIVDYVKNVEPTTVMGLSALGSWRRTQGVGLSPTAVDTRAGEATALTLAFIGQYSKFIEPRGWLLELKSGLSGTDERQEPYSTLPTGRMLSRSDTLGGYPSAITSLAFGGNGVLDSHRRTGLWENQASLDFFAPGLNRHEFRVAADVRLDVAESAAGVDRYGTYRYESLTNLSVGRASSFARTLRAPAASAGVWNAFASIGDEWRVKPGLRLLYGVRVEGNRYLSAPARNAALVDALNVATDHVPNRIDISPRLGFSWRRTVRDDGYGGGRFGSYRLPRRTMVRGGIGQFRDLLTPDLVAYARSNSGLVDATTQLLCTGDAVPEPQWSSWVAGGVLPSACANGAPSAFVDAAPRVTALHPDLNAPRSWRANLSISGVQWKTGYTLEGIVSLNRNQFGNYDANFSGIQRFALEGEGRPVYVQPSSIVATTGAVSPVDSRLRSEFSRVSVQHSQLQSVSRQLALTLSPTTFSDRWWASGSYVLGFVRQYASGFDAATFEDPRARSWSRADLDARHQFQLQAGVALKSVTLTLFTRVASGMSFTPMVGSDVNGDGVSNDVAFVYDPSAPNAPSAVRDGLSALLASAQSHTRACLERSFGKAAGRNSCSGPWTASLNARLAVDGASVGLGKRVKIGLNLSNPLGGLDQLLHRDKLRGWGTPASPDRVLLFARSFDASKRAFTYAVNPRFGDTRPRAGGIYVPFRATVDVSLDLAPTLALQQMQKWLSPGRHGQSSKRLTAKDYLDRFMRGSPDAYSTILRQSDSLLLNRSQTEALQAAQKQYRAKVQLMWQDLATDLAAQDDSYDAHRFELRQHTVADSVWTLAGDDLRAVLPKVLSGIQLQLLPASAASYYKSKDNRRPFYFFF